MQSIFYAKSSLLSVCVCVCVWACMRVCSSACLCMNAPVYMVMHTDLLDILIQVSLIL